MKKFVLFALCSVIALMSGGQAAEEPNDIVGMAITRGEERVYAWYRDGTVSSGTNYNLAKFRKKYRYVMPLGETPDSIVGMAIAKNTGNVFAWFRGGTVSSGTSERLDAYRKKYPYKLPQGITPDDIVGMGIAGDTGHVFAWYKDGTVSSGTSDNLDKHRKRYPYSLPGGITPMDIVGMAISYHPRRPGIALGIPSRVYAWYRNGTVSAGTSDDLDKSEEMHPFILPE